jgi:hypothetical protein
MLADSYVEMLKIIGLTTEKFLSTYHDKNENISKKKGIIYGN